MKTHSILLFILFVSLGSFHYSFAQDSAKARGLTESPSKTSASITGTEVECQANRAGNYPCESINLMAFLSVRDMSDPLITRSTSVNDIWGWTDQETGVEYALVGMNNGTMFISLSNPESPEVIGFLETKTVSSSWRDIKVYKDHAYIVADNAGSHGIQIFDLTTLRNLTEPTDLVETANYDGIGSAHNIVINEGSGYAYAVGSNSGGNTCGGALHMINIQDPVNPSFAGCFADSATGFAGTGYTHDAQCVIYSGPDTEHQGKEICVGSNETYISVADVSNKANPVALSKGTYPDAGYIHQGWFSEDQRFFFQDDELDEGPGRETRTLVWDLEDLDDPVLLGDFFSGLPAIDHNMYVRGEYLYQANYTSGLRVWNISNPASPQFAAFFDTFPNSDGGNFAGAWSNYPYFDSGLVIVSSIGEGLFVLKPNLSKATSIENPEIVASFEVAPPYPNPSQGTATVTITSQREGTITVDLIDATGRVVRSFPLQAVAQQSVTRITVDTQGLSSGSYLVRVRDERSMQIHPFTILN